MQEFNERPIRDYFNHQFTVEYFLDDNGFDSKVVEFAKKNNLDINYIAIKRLAKDGKWFLVTTDLVSKPKNGYRVISIDNVEGEDTIIDMRKDGQPDIIVRCNNVQVKVSRQYSLDTLMKHLNETLGYSQPYENDVSDVGEFEDGDYFCTRKYAKDFDITQVKRVRFCRNESQFHLALTYAEHLIFSYEFTRPFTSYDFKNAKNLKTIVLGQQYDCPIDPTFLPKTLEELTLGIEYTQVLPSLPIKKLVLGQKYNHQFTEVYPNLEYLEYGQDWTNELVPGHLFPKLKTIVFDKNYKKVIDKNVLASYPSLTNLTVPKECLPYETNLQVTFI